VDIKGHDGVIYKGRLDVDKLPAVDLHKKNANSLLGPPPAPSQRSRLDTHLFPGYSQQRDSSSNEPERHSASPIIPNLEPILPREESLS